jgi:hypothetical protein
MLDIVIVREKEDSEVGGGGLIPHLVEGGVSVLQYANDTILFIEHDLQKVFYMGLILCIFDQLLSLKINLTMNFSILEGRRFLDAKLVLFLFNRLVSQSLHIRLLNKE